MQILKGITYFILSLQEKYLRHKLSKTIGVKNPSKRKRHYAEGITVDLNSMAEVEKERLEAEITNILKNYNYNPEKLLEYVKLHGTGVYYKKDAKKILNPVGEDEGFIYPAKGLRALYLSVSLNHLPKLKTNDMFVLSSGEINKYYFIYYFYNWYAFKHGIEGMDYESQLLLKKYLYTDSDLNELQMADIFKLKDAIKQDKASIEFVIKLCRNYEGVKNALEKMKDGGAKL